MTAWAVYFDELQSYHACADLQKKLVLARQQDQIPDMVLFVQHPPVITLGCRGRDNFLVTTPAQLSAQHIEIVHSDRGGDVTYHAPGQLIMYPILHLSRHRRPVHGYLSALEEIALQTAASFDVSAHRREGKNGAWTDKGKIAAIGFRIQRSVTSHGMSFNVDLDLAGFRHIVPCGLVGEPVTSLKNHLGTACPAISEVRTAMSTHFSTIMNQELIQKSPSDLVSNI